eukprot:scaffold6162_cov93-Skeletonema_dohrnii-CCMP3373.AAC.10
MSSRESSSPLNKIKDGVKKTSKKLEEDIIKTTEKIKLVRRGDAASERSPLKQRVKHAVRAMNSKNSWEDGDVTSSSPANLATQTSGDVNYASLESDVGSSSNNINTIDEGNDEEETSSAANNQPLSTANDSASSSVTLVQLLFITIISVSTVFHTWLYRLDIISNQIPFIVAIHWALVAYFIGSSSSLSEKVVVLSIDDIALDEEDASNLTNNEESNDHRHVTFTKEEEEKAEAKTKQLIRRIPMGRRHYSKIKSAYLLRKESKESSPIEGFFTNLKPVGFTTTKNSPISEGMMDRLLKYSPDFRRRKSEVGEIDMATMLKSCLEVQDHLSKLEELEDEEKEEREVNYELGTAPLVNLKASKLERDFDYVEPLCKFRGMDMFVGDFPEKEIWKQPLLLKNGLRDTATVIGNMMLPTGNLVSYLQMPDWFDDWDNIPEETEDDPPDIKAFKRFFTGDLEYQRRRAKIVPMVVKAPYVVKMIAPNPSEMTMHTPRHPVSVTKVNKVVDPATGETTAAAVMELGVDFYTSAAIGRIINVVMPHLGKITVDVALVIHPPWEAEGEEANEPSACIGVWRIDQVDFLSCAQLPEKPIEVVEEEIKDIMKSLAMESGGPGD